MTIKEFIQVTFSETNPKLIEIEVFYYENIIKNTLLEDQYQYQDKIKIKIKIKKNIKSN